MVNAQNIPPAISAALRLVRYVLLGFGLGSLSTCHLHAQTSSGNATRLQGRPIATTAPTNTQCLIWSSGAGKWQPGACASGSGSIPSTTDLLSGDGAGNGADSGIGMDSTTASRIHFDPANFTFQINGVAGGKSGFTFSNGAKNGGAGGVSFAVPMLRPDINDKNIVLDIMPNCTSDAACSALAVAHLAAIDLIDHDLVRSAWLAGTPYTDINTTGMVTASLGGSDAGSNLMLDPGGSSFLKSNHGTMFTVSSNSGLDSAAITSPADSSRTLFQVTDYAGSAGGYGNTATMTVMSNLMGIGWGTESGASGLTYGAVDTMLRRDSAGVIGFGTGPSGDLGGSWKATNGTLSGLMQSASAKVTGLGGSGNRCLHVDNVGAISVFSADCSSGGSPLTTKGDIFGHSTVDERIPVGSNGQVLTADSTQTLGIKWATPSGGGGDVFLAAANVFTNTQNIHTDNASALVLTGADGSSDSIKFSASNNCGVSGACVRSDGSNVGISANNRVMLAVDYGNRVDFFNDTIKFYPSGDEITPGSITLGGHIVSNGTAPGISGCGTGAALDSNASDEGGSLTLGTAPGSCVITFATTYTTNPKCAVTFEGGVLGAYSHSATAITIIATGLTGGVDYRCAK